MRRAKRGESLPNGAFRPPRASSRAARDCSRAALGQPLPPRTLGLGGFWQLSGGPGGSLPQGSHRSGAKTARRALRVPNRSEPVTLRDDRRREAQSHRSLARFRSRLRGFERAWPIRRRRRARRGRAVLRELPTKAAADHSSNVTLSQFEFAVWFAEMLPEYCVTLVQRDLRNDFERKQLLCVPRVDLEPVGGVTLDFKLGHAASRRITNCSGRGAPCTQPTSSVPPTHRSPTTATATAGTAAAPVPYSALTSSPEPSAGRSSDSWRCSDDALAGVAP